LLIAFFASVCWWWRALQKATRQRRKKGVRSPRLALALAQTGVHGLRRTLSVVSLGLGGLDLHSSLVPGLLAGGGSGSGGGDGGGSLLVDGDVDREGGGGADADGVADGGGVGAAASDRGDVIVLAGNDPDDEFGLADTDSESTEVCGTGLTQFSAVGYIGHAHAGECAGTPALTPMHAHRGAFPLPHPCYTDKLHSPHGMPHMCVNPSEDGAVFSVCGFAVARARMNTQPDDDAGSETSRSSAGTLTKAADGADAPGAGAPKDGWSAWDHAPFTLENYTITTDTGDAPWDVRAPRAAIDARLWL
jgi:hypothetical protein